MWENFQRRLKVFTAEAPVRLGQRSREDEGINCLDVVALIATVSHYILLKHLIPYHFI